MSYPIHLLPNKHFNRIGWHKELNNHYLIRYTYNQDFIDDDGKLKPSSLVPQTDHLRDFSTSLLGKFDIDDIYLKIIGDNELYFLADWEEGTEVKIPSFNEDFSIELTRGRFFFCIGDLHNVELSKYEDKTEVIPFCSVIHTPINCNFWHFSIRWFHNGVDLISWTKDKRRRILSSAKAFLIERAIIKEPIYEELSVSHYFKC
jgi:hypothetical protein